MPTDSDEEDWYDRRKRIDAEENRRIRLEQQQQQHRHGGGISDDDEDGGGLNAPPQIRRPLMLARNQAFVIAGIGGGESALPYDDVYEGASTYR